MNLASDHRAPGKRIAVLGAGNGGHALAGHLALAGHEVRWWNRSPERLSSIRKTGAITLIGAVEGTGRVRCATTDLAEAVRGAELIMIATTADAHDGLARDMAPLVERGQIIVLNPGRTGGALTVKKTLRANGAPEGVAVAEAQSLVYACRLDQPGQVRVIGVKKYVPVAAHPGADTPRVIACLQEINPCFQTASSVLRTSFENIGAILHPSIVLVNGAAIERGEDFYFYRDMTAQVAALLVALDNERLELGRAYGERLTSLFDWISTAYPDSTGATLCERMRQNPAYADIRSPNRLDSRYLTEDLPTGLIPMTHFGEAAGLRMPLTRSVIELCSQLLGRNFWPEGRTLEKMGLAGLDAAGIIAAVR